MYIYIHMLVHSLVLQYSYSCVFIYIFIYCFACLLVYGILLQDCTRILFLIIPTFMVLEGAPDRNQWFNEMLRT